ncbi:MAG TPA: hypothetical protein VEC57_00070 [Candidatus Limnocylindrales bacterium]|nr:hypothetical protein [Candidatus Limnocylindrales bacterium]
MALSGNPVVLGNNANRPAGSVSPVGSSSSTTTDNAIVRWDGTTGTLIQNSAVTVADTTGAMAWDSGQNALLTAASGRSLILQSGGVTALTLDSSQNATFAGEVRGAGNIYITTGSTRLSAAADGVLRISNAAATDFSRLQFGGTSASFPALKRLSAALQVITADDGGYAELHALRLLLSGTTQIRAGTGTPEGAVTAPVGSLFLRTDGGASTTLYVKESGAGNTGWIAK